MNCLFYLEFHISRLARERYGLDESLFSTDGRVILVNISESRQLASQINAGRNLVNFPEQAIQAGEINALGLIDEILHKMIREYQQRQNPRAIAKATTWLDDQIGRITMDKTLLQFIDEFPPFAVYQGRQTPEDYLGGVTRTDEGDKENRQILIEELLILWITNTNPAARQYQELFDDGNLRSNTAYPQIIDELHTFFNLQPRFEAEELSLLDLLRSPAIAVPGSLNGQIEFIRSRWGLYVEEYISRLLTSQDLIREETKPNYGPGPGPIQIPDFTLPDFYNEVSEIEDERFSPDLDWMPRVVLLAKNSYVWLDQLSKKYGRNITRLDEIPNQELEALRRWGVTGLWLIGLWERSPASQKIKQLRGNPEAVASAYSLFDYDIASDLGGWEAFQNLQLRTNHLGIRLSSDMVPNHMGIDSRWVIEHPDWFISLDQAPFPTYSFNGLNLSWDQRVGIFLEDHYYDNSDAAVVFKRIDFWTQSVKYIYHGNDGTSMPWNDTAQLNFLIPEVREAVIQTILHVARNFPIIRFDAAMTLAKRHYHRLWFPEPGSGGDIPSRAGLGLNKEAFDSVFPEEFWREVVDRVANEAPDTLLLAEAFWLMEGYFVRTLGMHRVYNSAFMNMLRDEKNQEYRLVIKNTIEFDAEILKRYVNFMNNPDERTAVDQFGKGDKYFGVCTMLATMPGLPMIGHGQVEGYTEKYGMEYRRSYWNEEPDPYLLDRHEKEIFPLFRKRALFAEVNDFLLFDFFTSEGSVDEDVFIYTNRRDANKSLVIYQNRYKTTSGWIHTSSSFSVKAGDDKVLIQKTLAQALLLPEDPETFLVLRDSRNQLEYIRNCEEIHKHGFFIELLPYQCLVFLDFQIVFESEDTPYGKLTGILLNRGVPDIQEALQEFKLAPILTPFKNFVNKGYLEWLIQNRSSERGKVGEHILEALDEGKDKLRLFYQAVSNWLAVKEDFVIISSQIDSLVIETIDDLANLLALPAFGEKYPLPRSKTYQSALEFLLNGTQKANTITTGNSSVWGTLIGWLLINSLRKLVCQQPSVDDCNELINNWLLGNQIQKALREMGVDEWNANRSKMTVNLLLDWSEALDYNLPPEESAQLFLKNEITKAEVQKYLNINRYDNVLWFNHENFEEMTWWLLVIHTVSLSKKVQDPAQGFIRIYKIIEALLDSERKSGYQLENLLV